METLEKNQDLVANSNNGLELETYKSEGKRLIDSKKDETQDQFTNSPTATSPHWSNVTINKKPKNKPICYHYGKLEHTRNICRSKIGKKRP